MPGIEEDIASEFIAMAEKLPHIRFILRLFKSDYDIVAKFGRVFLGWIPPKMSTPKNLFLSLFKFAWESEYSSGLYMDKARKGACVNAVDKEGVGRFQVILNPVLAYTIAMVKRTKPIASTLKQTILTIGICL